MTYRLIVEIDGKQTVNSTVTNDTEFDRAVQAAQNIISLNLTGRVIVEVTSK